MKKKKIFSALAVLVFLCILGGKVFLSEQAEGSAPDRLASWTGSAFTGQGLLYQEDIEKDGTYECKGLYYKDCQSPDAEEQVISDNYGSYLDVQEEDVYYVDYEYNMFHYHLGTGETELLLKSDGNPMGPILLAGDNLYFLRSAVEDEQDLNVLHLPTGEVKMLLEDVNWHYLYRYQDAVAVLSKDYKNFMVCDAEHGLITTYPCYEGEIVGCLEDGSVIFSHENQIMKADGFGKEEGEVLFQSEDHIYSILMKGKEMVITTNSDHGMMQLFVYNLEENSCEKLANVSFRAYDITEDYIACNSGYMPGRVELIDRHTGEIRAFAAH